MSDDGFTLETHTAGDGYAWRYRRYPAAGAERGRVVCLHGIQSHGGWYGLTCRRLAAAGYAVSFLDRRGSGLNEQARGDTPSGRRLLDDVGEFLRAQPPAPGRPTFMLAISWGGKLAVGLERRHPGLTDGLVLLCPGLCPRIGPPLSQRLRIAWARLVAPTRMFPIPLDDPELFTASPEGQQFIRDDPLALRRATARFLFSSAWLDLYARRASRQVKVPALLMLAEHDRIIDNARTRAFVARFPGDLAVIEHHGAHHTLEFEASPERYLELLLDWLAART